MFSSTKPSVSPPSDDDDDDDDDDEDDDEDDGVYDDADDDDDVDSSSTNPQILPDLKHPFNKHLFTSMIWRLSFFFVIYEQPLDLFSVKSDWGSSAGFLSNFIKWI